MLWTGSDAVEDLEPEMRCPIVLTLVRLLSAVADIILIS